MDCPFCQDEVTANKTIIGESTHAVAWLHESRAHRGHSVVASRRHCENLTDLDEVEAADFLRLERTVESAVLSETDATRAVLVKLGLQVPHLHVHVYPVGADFDRKAVMEVIDGKVTDTTTAEQKRVFAELVKSRIEKDLAQ